MAAATVIELSAEERAQLEKWVRATTTERRLHQRARIVLECAAGSKTKDVASLLGVREATVSKWRTRFAKDRNAGLNDAPRPGRQPIYGKETERRILSKLDEPPPDGHATWNGGLVAKSLGDVSADYVWRVLRKYGIHLQRRRSFRVSDAPGLPQRPPA